MRTLGLLGGMSWESTALYYRMINEAVQARLGGLHSAQLAMFSVDFHEIERLQSDARWEEAGHLLARRAQGLQAAGAEAIVLCTNTMHRVGPAIESALSIPLLHIADATGDAVRAAGLQRVGLLATRFTMEQEFYIGRLRQTHGLDVVVPDSDDRALVHRIIYSELCQGRVLPESREAFRAVMRRLVAAGTQGVIFGCTEITMLVDATDTTVPTFDSTALHAMAAVDWALA